MSEPPIIAMDCEMVEGTDGGKKRHSILARVSLVNSQGECIYDHYVKPIMEVTDYRTQMHGITPEKIFDLGKDFNEVRDDVENILCGCILVGHDLRQDLNVLKISHPSKLIRDTYNFSKFRREAVNGLKLKKLARQFLAREIQEDVHDSVEDARAAMDLYMEYRSEWEEEFN